MLCRRLLPLTLPLLALAQDAGNSSASLNATLSGNDQLTNLTTFLSLNPTLMNSLSNASNITILAPSNDAFATFIDAAGGANAVMSDPGLVAAILSYHVLDGTFYASSITNTSQFIPTMLSNTTYTNVTDGQAVEVLTIGNETVVYSGLLQNATVTQADLNFTGGVIHILDTVLTIPLNVTDTALAANLTAFRGAVNATDLTTVVNETPDLTIFAPDNEAFRSIGSALSELSTDDLSNILAYHVVSGTLGYSSALENGTNLTTLNGGDIEITIDENGTYYANAARVVAANLLVANGVVHIIDNLLNPNSTMGPSTSATSGAAAYSGTAVSDIPFTSGLPSATTTINPTSQGAGPAQNTATSTSSGAAMPMATGAVGYGALFGAGAAIFLGV